MKHETFNGCIGGHTTRTIIVAKTNKKMELEKQGEERFVILYDQNPKQNEIRLHP